MIGKSTLVVFTVLGVAASVPAGEPSAKLVHEAAVDCFAFAPATAGKTLLASAAEKSVYLWDYATGKPAGEPKLTKHGRAFELAFSPDGKTLAIGCQDDVLIWDVSEPAKPKNKIEPIPMPRGKGRATHFTFAGDGRKLYGVPIASGATTLLEWDLDKEKVREVCDIPEHVFGLAWSGAAGEILVLGYSDDRVTIAPVDKAGKLGRARSVTGKFLFSRTVWAGIGEKDVLDPHLPCLTGYVPQGDKGAARLLVCAPERTGESAGQNGGAGLYVWDCTEGKPGDEEMHFFPRGEKTTVAYSGAISPDGTRVAAAVVPPSANSSCEIILYDTSGKRAKERTRLTPFEGKTFDRLAFSPDQKWLVVSSAQAKELKVWNLKAVSKPADK